MYELPPGLTELGALESIDMRGNPGIEVRSPQRCPLCTCGCELTALPSCSRLIGR